MGKDLEITPQVWYIKELLKFDFIKIKTFCTSKDTVKKMKSQTPVWGEDTYQILDLTKFASRIYKELIQLNKTKQFLKSGK